MNSTSLRTTDPPDHQETAAADEFHPTPAVRVTMEQDGDGRQILRRHRVNPALTADRVAVVTHAGGVVSDIEWDEQQRESLGVWAVLAERWARARIAEQWSTS
jgi:hypothetical protein